MNLTVLQVTRPAANQAVQQILTLDACTTSHFSLMHMLRDITKAFGSFAAHRSYLERDSGCGATEATISTGRWGCGAFGGTPSHKFVQQVIAAHLARVRLEFSMFGTPDGCDVLWNALCTSPFSIAHVWRCLLECRDPHSFEQDFIAKLQQNTPPEESTIEELHVYQTDLEGIV